MTSIEAKQESPYIQEVEGHEKRRSKLIRFTGSSTKAAALMLFAAIAALIIANTDFYEPFYHFFHTEVGIFFGDKVFEMSLAHVINDVLMAVFFLLIGLEIKYEMTVGQLTNIRQALLPVIAAVGGVLGPIVIYLIFNAGNPETSHGWGVPTATDIAFALGIMSLLGSRVPVGIKVFLTTLAVADDIIAILIIAIFYGQSPEVFWLVAVGVITVVLVLMNRCHVYSLAPYILVGIVLWYCVYMSGIHATIAGVLLALTIPTGSKVNLKSFISWSGEKVEAAKQQFTPSEHIMGQEDYMHTVTSLSKVANEVIPPATRLEHKLYPWVYFLILPLFALTNADVRFVGGGLGDVWADPVLPGIFFGLLLGKPIGILLFSFITTKLKIASLPENVSWLHMVGAGILGGVGFTMAIFVANLAFVDDAITTTAKLAILTASALAGVLGFMFLWFQARKDKKRGVAYITTSTGGANHQTAAIEDARAGKEILEALESPLLRDEIKAAEKSCGGSAEVVVDLGEDEVLSYGESSSPKEPQK